MPPAEIHPGMGCRRSPQGYRLASYLGVSEQAWTGGKSGTLNSSRKEVALFTAALLAGRDVPFNDTAAVLNRSTYLGSGISHTAWKLAPVDADSVAGWSGTNPVVLRSGNFHVEGFAVNAADAWVAVKAGEVGIGPGVYATWLAPPLPAIKIDMASHKGTEMPNITLGTAITHSPEVVRLCAQAGKGMCPPRETLANMTGGGVGSRGDGPSGDDIEDGEGKMSIHMLMESYDSSLSKLLHELHTPEPGRAADPLLPGAEQQLVELVRACAVDMQLVLGDVKPSNVLARRNALGRYTLALSDFDVASYTHVTPSLSAACRTLVMLAKLQAQLACSQISPRRASFIAAHVDALAVHEPQCAAAIFADTANMTTWLSVPPELQEVVLDLPCTLRLKPYQFCVTSHGMLRRFSDVPTGTASSAAHFRGYSALPPLSAEGTSSSYRQQAFAFVQGLARPSSKSITTHPHPQHTHLQHPK